MANPMTKKNPLLSIWLSAANAWAGAARGHLAAALRRQQAAVLRAATRPMARKRKHKTTRS
jgi:hypothetical protein